ncbi:arsenate reductase ArsC [candidate division KSB3 bacterium]|uniref:Arsenate reductase ArsC n=1 Tax=candidate division KSB3 bacterium TaxID=2044937 RepID=A0A9D5JYL4_9BACT|nr:arsenate reductase ArsC [candidate division KSB3 bacterium]MBD3326769.1 arsenate reductase ArsC [candidate division KSB3 bacterium]
MKQRILFICTHNSARSQLAEGLVNHYFAEAWEAQSAGTVATAVKPHAIRTMADIGIDISHHTSKPLDAFRDQEFDVVVTVCDSAREACPFFPGKTVIHHSFKDPSHVEGHDDERLAAFCQTRDEIHAWLRRTLPVLAR